MRLLSEGKGNLPRPSEAGNNFQKITRFFSYTAPVRWRHCTTVPGFHGRQKENFSAACPMRAARAPVTAPKLPRILPVTELNCA